MVNYKDWIMKWQSSANMANMIVQGVKSFNQEFDSSTLSKKLGIDELTASFIIQKIHSSSVSEIKDFVKTGRVSRLSKAKAYFR